MHQFPVHEAKEDPPTAPELQNRCQQKLLNSGYRSKCVTKRAIWMKRGDLNLHWSPQCWNGLVSLTEPAHTSEKARGAGSSSVRTNSGGRTAAAGVTHCWETKPGIWSYFLLLYSVCVFVCVCVVDGAFVSGSEVTRLVYFWNHLSIMKSAGSALPGSGIRAAGLCAQLTAGTARQGVLQLPALMIQERWTGSTSIHTCAADCTFKAKHTNLPQKQKCLTQCCWSLSVSGLQCPGQIRAETAILWYFLLRTCLYGDPTCGVGLALTSSVWSVKRMRSSLCIYDYIDTGSLRQE